MSNIEGVIEAARFSWNCRPENKELCDGLFSFVKGNGQRDVNWVVRQLTQLYSYFYYCLIAEQNGISDPFDSRVVRAHWIGNDLLKVPKKNDIELVLKIEQVKMLSEERRAMLKWLLTRLVVFEACPHHSFHATLNQKLNPELARKNKRCFVDCGRVIELGDSSLVVDMEDKKRECGYGFLQGELKANDLVLIHLNEVRRLAQRGEKTILNGWSAVTACSLRLV